jgi:hypothetical protein
VPPISEAARIEVRFSHKWLEVSGPLNFHYFSTDSTLSRVSHLQTPENQTKFPYVQCSPTSGDAPDATTVRALVDESLQDLRPKIKDFLSRSLLPIWQPSEQVDEETKTFYRRLAIPAIGSQLRWSLR